MGLVGLMECGWGLGRQYWPSRYRSHAQASPGIRSGDISAAASSDGNEPLVG